MNVFHYQFLEQFLKFLVNFTLLKYVKSQRSYGVLITKELIFGFQILDLKDHFSASLMSSAFVVDAERPYSICDAEYDLSSLPSNKRCLFQVNFLINASIEHLRRRSLLKGGIKGRRLFHISPSKYGVYCRAAFKRANTATYFSYNFLFPINSLLRKLE